MKEGVNEGAPATKANYNIQQYTLLRVYYAQVSLEPLRINWTAF